MFLEKEGEKEEEPKEEEKQLDKLLRVGKNVVLDIDGLPLEKF